MPFERKQLMQLASKMRFVSAQLEVLLGGELWLRSASHANEMAALLADGLERLDGAELVHPVEANGVFARLPPPSSSARGRAARRAPLLRLGRGARVVRLMCSWDTTPDDVEGLLSATERRWRPRPRAPGSAPARTS